ncbi:MAG: hypothetical protein KTR17_02905 [Cellvibrionaceae bacterium]|nr:hypothetical protein [Cellvibrionaceae bacterium]
MNKNLPTEAGQPESAKHFSERQIDTINTLFAVLKRNYHNQYFKAFANANELKAVKRLWLESLQRFDCDIILQATKALLENEEFLPTLATVIKYCEKIGHQDLPEAHEAYLEACRAPSPKANAHWSHPAVYCAGKACDWYFLLNNPEYRAFPIFREHYEKMCAKVLRGESLEIQRQALPEKAGETKVDRAKNKQKLQALRKALQL